MVKAGEATLEYRGTQKLDGQDAVLIIFRAEAINFLDEEKIFVDPVTFLPIRVERDLNIWGAKEKIIEYYDQNKFEVKVVKNSGGKITELVIKKDAAVDNIYSFLYRYRRSGAFTVGETLHLNLPTQSVDLTLKSRQKIDAAGKTYDAYYLESKPEKYCLWFDTGESKIPLRIDGAISFGNTAMIMRKYEKP